MTELSILLMARKVDFRYDPNSDAFKALVRFVELVAEAERETCAKLCDERAQSAPMGSDEQCEAEDCASAIRARGEGK